MRICGQARLLGGLTAVAIAALSAPAQLASGGEEGRVPTHVVEGERYRLVYDGARAEAEEAGRVLESAWAGFAAHFGQTPRLRRGERLAVRFLADRPAFEAAIREAGTEPPAGGAGGYYWPPAQTAFLYRQPTRYFTRVLLLHEAAHQFHFLAMTDNEGPRGPWYAEGVAEHLSWHVWDGARTTLGVVPLVTLKDYPAEALATLASPDFDLRAFALGRGGAERALCWALYGYLATGREGVPLRGFARFRERMDAGRGPENSWLRSFGDPEAHRAPLLAWLRAHQAPWEQIFNQWEGVGQGRVRGQAQVVTLAKPKAPVEQIRATFALPSREGWKVGLLLHYLSPEDYTVGLVTSTLAVEVNRRRGDRWERLLARGAPAPDPDGSYGIAAVREAGVVRFFVSETEMGAFELPGQSLGLALDGTSLVFENVRAR